MQSYYNQHLGNAAVKYNLKYVLKANIFQCKNIRLLETKKIIVSESKDPEILCDTDYWNSFRIWAKFYLAIRTGFEDIANPLLNPCTKRIWGVLLKRFVYIYMQKQRPRVVQNTFSQEHLWLAASLHSNLKIFNNVTTKASICKNKFFPYKKKLTFKFLPPENTKKLLKIGLLQHWPEKG